MMFETVVVPTLKDAAIRGYRPTDSVTVAVTAEVQGSYTPGYVQMKVLIILIRPQANTGTFSSFKDDLNLSMLLRLSPCATL